MKIMYVMVNHSSSSTSGKEASQLLFSTTILCLIMVPPMILPQAAVSVHHVSSIFNQICEPFAFGLFMSQK